MSLLHIKTENIFFDRASTPGHSAWKATILALSHAHHLLVTVLWTWLMAKKSLNMMEKMMDRNIIDYGIINCAIPLIITIENCHQVDFGKPVPVWYSLLSRTNPDCRTIIHFFQFLKNPAGKITRILLGIPGDGGYLVEGNPRGNLGGKWNENPRGNLGEISVWILQEFPGDSELIGIFGGFIGDIAA